MLSEVPVFPLSKKRGRLGLYSVIDHAVWSTRCKINADAHWKKYSKWNAMRQNLCV